MPRTRPHLDRDDKVHEIVAIAERQLLDGGYPALSMAAIARELGVAQNAVYWYFPSRDHLLIAALERIIGNVMAQKPKGRDTLGRIFWFADQLEAFQALRAAVSERAKASPLVADFERAFDEQVHALASIAMVENVAPEEVPLTADALLALVEGVLMRKLPRKRREAVIRFGFERLTGASTRPT